MLMKSIWHTQKIAVGLLVLALGYISELSPTDPLDRPDNWVKGAEQYAKGWIECFHAYQGLGPAETHWPIEKFMSYTEDDLMKDVFADGHVDIAIFQPTYLKEWYAEGFNTTERNAALGSHPVLRGEEQADWSGSYRTAETSADSSQGLNPDHQS